MSKYTPGPWHIAVMESPDDDIDVRAHMNTQIARLWLDDAPDYEWNDQQRANANLIAAAPDMLDALKASYAVTKDALDDLRSLGAQDSILAMRLANSERVIREAIAKAEGKA